MARDQRRKQISVLVKSTSARDVATDKALRDLQAEVRGRSFGDGARLLEGVELVGSRTNRVAHGLGRRVEGLVVVRQHSVVDRRVISCVDFDPAIDANWTKPNLSTPADWYVTTAAPSRIHYPLHVAVGERITELRVLFFRNGAVNPANMRLYSATTGAAPAEVLPTVAWTTPTATGVWQEIYGSYDALIGQADYVGSITANNVGDKVRAAFVTVENVPLCLVDETAQHTDGDKFLYLTTSNLSAEVDLLVF